MATGSLLRGREEAPPSAGRPQRPRWRLGKREWQDVRRACKLEHGPGVHSVDIHGVRVNFLRPSLAQAEPQQESRRGAVSPHGSGQQEAGSPPPAKQPSNSRQRRSANRRETWWAKLEASRAAAAASVQARSSAMVAEVRGVLAEMRDLETSGADAVTTQHAAPASDPELRDETRMDQSTT